MEKQLKYKSLKEFRKYNPNEVFFLRKNNLIDQLCSDMGWNRGRYKGVWSIKENVLSEGLKFSSIQEWHLNSKRSLKSARENDWLEEASLHMKKPYYKWTKEQCIEEAKKYKTIGEWRENNPTSYVKAKKNSWLLECGKHIYGSVKPKGYWTKETCITEAQKYQNTGEWRRGNQSSLAMARKNKWLEECTAHMNKLQIQKPTGYWNKERCIESALKHSTRSDWQKNEIGAVSYARKNKIYDECTTHMIVRITKPHRYWYTKENCINSALEYDVLTRWSTDYKAAYQSAKINGWLDECTAHMNKNKNKKKNLQAKK